MNAILLISCFFFPVSQSKLVRYSITVDRIPSNADGYPQSVIKVSDDSFSYADPNHRAFPGPLLRATKGDTVEVKVNNHFVDKVTSIHFHGLHMKNNAWMDGVGGVTQHPIAPMSFFTYLFNVTQTGTYWYHSHSGHQYVGGLLGPIVIDYPHNEVDPVKAKFDYDLRSESVIILQDWFHEDEDILHLNYKGPYNAFKKQVFQPNYPWRPHSLLMNGRGQFDCKGLDVEHECVEFFNNPCGNKRQCIRQRVPFLGNCAPSPHKPDEHMCIGKYHRMRLISGAANAPLKLWIDRHNMTVVARDGVETQPVTLDFVILPVGMRLDVIIHCDQPVSKYYIFSTVAIPFLPEGANEPKIQISVFNFLTYPGALVATKPKFWPEEDDITAGTEMFEYALPPLVSRIAPPAIKRFILQYSDTYSDQPGEPLEEWITNNITHVMPSSPMMQAAYLGHFPNSTVVHHKSGPKGNERKTHLIQLEYNKTYEFVMIGISGQQHPWHLHGYTVDFISVGMLNSSTDFVKGGKDICGWDTKLACKNEVIAALPPFDIPAKVKVVADSYTVPRFGYSIFRVTTDNQGPWMLHCHVDWHMGMGMGMIISVEKDGLYPDVLPPPDDFPAYLPLSKFAKRS